MKMIKSGLLRCQEKKGMQSSEEKWPLRENTTPKGSGRDFRLSH